MAIANPSRKIITLAVISSAMVTWRELKQGHVPPPPHAYAGTMVVYGIDSVIAEFAPDIAVYLGVAWTLTIAYGSLGSLRGGLPMSFPSGGPKTQTNPTPGQPRHGRKAAAPARRKPSRRSSRAVPAPRPRPVHTPRSPRRRPRRGVASTRGKG